MFLGLFREEQIVHRTAAIAELASKCQSDKMHRPFATRPDTYNAQPLGLCSDAAATGT